MFNLVRNLITANKRNLKYFYAVTSKRHGRVNH